MYNSGDWADSSYINDEGMKAAVDMLQETGLVWVQVNRAAELPYIRRWLHQNYGTPDRAFAHAFHYGVGTIKFMVLSQPNVTFGVRDAFYVSKHIEELPEFIDRASHYVLPYVMWQESGLCLADIAALMVREGYNDGDIYAAMLMSGQLGLMDYDVDWLNDYSISLSKDGVY
ncbi:hypothetical protein D1872_51210 [compost metagenome]